MSAKRRKKNDSEPSPRPVRSLDFFFGKKTQKQELNKLGKDEQGEGIDELAGSQSEMTDEQYARKLQHEWNRQAETADTAPFEPPPPPSFGSPPGKGLNVSVGGTLTTNSIPSTGSKLATLSLQSGSSIEDAVTASVPIDESPLTFDPALYLPGLKEKWAEHGGAASYALLTRCFVLVNSTQSRIKIVDNLTNLIRTIIEGDPESLNPAVWLATNAISPPYISLELGLGGSAISKALKKVYGLDSGGLKSLYDKHGDAGDVAFEAKKRQAFTLRKPKHLSIQGVYQSLVQIANSKGTGSQEFKQRIVERLLQDCQGAEESRYIVRTLAQHLRIGAVKTTMLIALSRAFILSKPANADFPTRLPSELAKLKKEDLALVYARGEELVKQIFARVPNYDVLVPCLLEVGLSDELLVRCGLRLHVPILPMLGSITRDLGEMLTKLQGRNFSCEFKYDGQRAQVHCSDDGKVSIYSRHLELMTSKYPDLVALVPQIRGDGVRSFILEGEVVAVDRDSGDLRAFQTLTNRAKKDVAIGDIKVDVCLFSFDLLFLNGSELLCRPFRERRELLRSLFVEIPNHFTWARSIDATSADSELVLDFFKSAIETKCEGIMVKVLDNIPNPALNVNAECEEALPVPSTPAKGKRIAGARSAAEKGEEAEKGGRRKALLATYEPDKRLNSWLKVKKDYDAAADSLDLIPIAAWHGQGRKAKWWSPILLAVRNPSTGTLTAVTKCISGFTDRFYAANKAKYAEGGPNVVSRPGYVAYSGGHPDVWFAPQEVWEVAFADITLSPTYGAAMGLVSEERGLSMRFPRFLRVREDKGVEEASTEEFLAGLWWKQVARARDERREEFGKGDGVAEEA